MNIKRLIYNTAAILVMFVLVFGGVSQALGASQVKTSGGGTVLTPAPPADPTPPPANPDAPPAYTSEGGGTPGTFEVNHTGVDGKPGTGDAQAKAVTTPPSTNATPTPPTDTYKSITPNILGCAVGQILASIITSGITAALNGLNGLLGVWTGFPTHDAQQNAQTGFIAATTNGFQIFGVYVGVSLNSIAYCIVNSILTYIADATIAWANSGFNGNPAFVQNPERFFQGLADQQMSQFIGALAYNKTINLNVCSPFRTTVAQNMATQYGLGGNSTAGVGGFKNYGSCTIDTTSNDYKNFASGKSSAGFWGQWGPTALRDENNPYGLYMRAQNYSGGLVQQKQNTAKDDLTSGRGFFSVQKCDTKDPNSCNTTVPSSLVNGGLQNTLNSGQNRLVLADKFDQVVTAIVNNLIKIALNKVLEPVNKNLPAGLKVQVNVLPTQVAPPRTGNQTIGNQQFDEFGRPVLKAIPVKSTTNQTSNSNTTGTGGGGN